MLIWWGHHHTYTNIDGMDYQILVEADFLVNLYEDSVPKAAAQNALDKIFKTQTGKTICKRNVCAVNDTTINFLPATGG